MHTLVFRVVNIHRTIGYLKTLALAADADTDYTQPNLTLPTAIVVGSEEKGVAHLTQERYTATISIPKHGQLASVSAGIALYEAVMQRVLAETTHSR